MKIESKGETPHMISIELPDNYKTGKGKNFLWVGVDRKYHNTVETKSKLLKLRKMIDICLKSLK